MTKDRTKIVQIMSDMLDNPDEYGIYPTTIAYDLLERLVEGARMEGIGWAYAEACATLDKGEDIRDTLVPDMLERARVDLQ
jgi:hypothetical protein